MKNHLSIRPLIWTTSVLLPPVLAVTSACSSGRDRPAASFNPQGGGSGFFTSGLGDGDGDETSGDGDGDGDTTAIAPLVEVLAPEEGDIVDSTIVVVCRVEEGAAGSALLDVTSIVGVVLDRDGEVLDSKPVSASEGDFEYSVSLGLGDYGAGLYSVGCRASSDGDDPGQGEDLVEVLLDLGPQIEVVSPARDAFLSAAEVHNFEYRIVPSPLFDDDDEAELAENPIVLIDGVEFELVPKPNADDIYWIDELSFNEREFDIVPDGPTSVLVKAKNDRGVESAFDYTITIDSVAPRVSIVSPAQGQIIGKRAVFVFEVTDEGSGVDWSTFVAEFSDFSLPYDPESDRWSLDGSVLSLSIPTAEVSSTDASQTQVHVQFQVSDRVGNTHVAESGRVFFLDQRSPVISLDPPSIRVRRRNASQQLECSHAFDPTGPASFDDGGATSDLTRFRAFALDRTNTKIDQEQFHYSTVDSDSLRLHVRRVDVPLVIDQDGDGTCDDVRIDDSVGVIHMDPVGPIGAPFFGDGTTDIAGPALLGCGYATAPDPDPPPNLCSGQASDMQYAAPQVFDSGQVPAVYAPLIDNGGSCTGGQIELRNLVTGSSDGWVCAAVVGADRAGNRTVSAPLAVCLGSCSDPMPVCTDDCTPLTIFESERIVDLY